MTAMVGAVLVLALLVLAALLLTGGATPLPRRISIDERRPQRPLEDFEIAVTDHRGDVKDPTTTTPLRTWLAAGGAIVAAVVIALVGAEI